MVDVERKNPARERLDAIGFQVELGSPRAITRALNIARTGFWFEQLVVRTNKLTPYCLGKHLQPATYRKNADAEPYHHNLWAKYARGAVVPSATSLQRVEAKEPGTSANFRHVLFDVLDPATPVKRFANDLLRRTHPGVQRAVFERNSLQRGHYQRRKQLRRVMLLLEAQGHLDALAGAIVLLREAQAAGREQDVYELGVTVHRTLLIACAIGPGASICAELSMLVSSLVLRSIDSLGRRFVTSLNELLWQRFVLLHTILQLEDRGQIRMRPIDTLQAATKILRGHYGDDLRFGLMPRLGGVSNLKELPEASRLDVVRDEVLGGWAREVLASHRVEADVPNSVMQEFINRRDSLEGPELERS